MNWRNGYEFICQGTWFPRVQNVGRGHERWEWRSSKLLGQGKTGQLVIFPCWCLNFAEKKVKLVLSFVRKAVYFCQFELIVFVAHCLVWSGENAHERSEMKGMGVMAVTLDDRAIA